MNFCICFEHCIFMIYNKLFSVFIIYESHHPHSLYPLSITTLTVLPLYFFPSLIFF